MVWSGVSVVVTCKLSRLADGRALAGTKSCSHRKVCLADFPSMRLAAYRQDMNTSYGWSTSNWGE